jgi:methyl-accepting chemotaxis protein
MQIRTRLLVSFLLLTMLIVLQFVFSSYVTQQQDSLVRQMVHEHEISHRLSGLASAAQKIRRYEKEYFIYVADENRRSHYFSEFQSAKSEIEGYLRGLRMIYTVDANDTELSRLGAWQDATAFYADRFENIHRDVSAGKITSSFAANTAIAEGKNRFRQVLTESHAAIDQQLVDARANSDMIFAYKADSSTLFALISAISVLFGLFISFQVPRSICKPVRELTELADGISKGRINVPVKITGSREIEDLSKSIERLRIAVRGLLLRVQRPKNAGLKKAG